MKKLIKINNCVYCDSEAILFSEIRNPASRYIFVICPSCMMRGPSIPITQYFQYFDNKLTDNNVEECNRTIRLWNMLQKRL
jgi:hypothetical protein